MKSISGAIFALMLLATGNAYASDEYAIVKTHIDQVTMPKDVGGVIKDCANNPACVAALEAVSKMAGVPPGVVSGLMAVINYDASASSDEDHYFQVNLPSGFRYCHSNITVTSIVPHDNGYSPTMGVQSTSSPAEGLNFYVRTPKLPWTGSRSWVEADVTIVGVAANLAEVYYNNGKCNRPPSQVISCKGYGVDGYPSCANSAND